MEILIKYNNFEPRVAFMETMNNAVEEWREYLGPGYLCVVTLDRSNQKFSFNFVLKNALNNRILRTSTLDFNQDDLKGVMRDWMKDVVTHYLTHLRQLYGMTTPAAVPYQKSGIRSNDDF